MYQHPDCCKFGCRADLANNTVHHAPECPVGKGRMNPPEPANIASFGAARFKKSNRPEDTKPEDVLARALEAVGEYKPDHVIVFFGRSTDAGGSSTTFFQGGNYRYHAQMGLCYEGTEMIREDG